MQSLFEAKQPNDYYELMELGIRAVHQTLVRYAKMQTGPIALEERYLFSEWLEFAKKLSLVIKVPIIELAEEHDLTETECVFILCLYAFHTSPFIRDACVAIRGDNRLCGFTPNMLIHLLIDGMEHIVGSNYPLLQRSNVLIYVRDNIYGISSEWDASKLATLEAQ